jgi:uncharacterized protein YicC (UPF0701 family)
MAERGQVVLSLIGRMFLNQRERIIDRLDAADEPLVSYVVKQIHQFRNTEGFALNHADSQHLEQIENEMLDKIIEWAPAERRIRGLPPEERLRGLSPEERLAGMSDEDTARLRELLNRKTNGPANN